VKSSIDIIPYGTVHLYLDQETLLALGSLLLTIKRTGQLRDTRLVSLLSEIDIHMSRQYQRRNSNLLDVHQTAYILKCSERYVRHVAQQGRLKGTKDNGHWLFTEADIEAFR
jgi:hypothetical protein